MSRELAVRIRFTCPCLGDTRTLVAAGDRTHVVYRLPRTREGRLVFMPSWWTATLRKAASTLGMNLGLVESIRFAQEVRGAPRHEWYMRRAARGRKVRHEYFDQGDVVAVTCLVPDGLDDDQFVSLLSFAGRYYGISPSQPNSFGFYEVVTVATTSTV